MRTATAIKLFAIGLMVGNCSTGKQPLPKVSAIGIQPIGLYDKKQLAFIRHEVSSFFCKPVVVFPEINMPAQYLNMSKGERYSADSIIAWLSHKTNDTIFLVAGITHKDIYTALKDAKGQARAPKSKYKVWGIMGLGFCPGNACVISDFRMKTTDTAKFNHRLRTVTIHEIGHNLGLPHCPNKHCIMNDVNGTIKTVDNASFDYCLSCREKLDTTNSGK